MNLKIICIAVNAFFAFSSEHAEISSSLTTVGSLEGKYLYCFIFSGVVG